MNLGKDRESIDAEAWELETREMYAALGQARTAGDAWFLPSPITARELAQGDYLVDVVVAHGIRPDPKLSSAPEVVEVSKVVRADGGPLGARAVSLDLRGLAVDAVVCAAPGVMLRHGDGYTAGGDPEAWREAAHVVRFAASDFNRFRWTEPLDSLLIDWWAHLAEHRCGTQADLADELGTTPERIGQRLLHLRKKYPDRVPRGTPGRRTKGEDEI